MPTTRHRCVPFMSHPCHAGLTIHANFHPQNGEFCFSIEHDLLASRILVGEVPLSPAEAHEPLRARVTDLCHKIALEFLEAHDLA